jgi:uncharacterized protein YbcV (DUF1398 family)
MSKAVENLVKAQKYAMSIRPNVGGFPFLAEALRQAGVKRNLWSLPSCQSIYITKLGTVIQPGEPLVTQTTDVPAFSEKELIQALRKDQAGKSSFPMFLKESWEAGVIGYDVDFEKRTCTYFGAKGESYTEEYPLVEIKN